MVLVCNDPRFVFIKTRKTGGTSVEMALQKAASISDAPVIEQTDAVITPRGIVGRRKLPADQASPEGRIWYNHMPAAEVRQHLGHTQWNDSTIIATVRNPFARMVSQFHFRRSRDGAAPLGDRASAQADFLKFLQSDSWSDDRD
ncbi:sulfotransferase family 2 domain-containing protein, partial [Escherichia coli]|nr:sulfotransferase family 2 domain-containing protein [Escherichia coli]